MIRNLKVLGLAAMAVLAVSAIGAAGAQAATFTAATTPVNIVTTPDGSAKTAHQVFDAAGATITCNRVTGTATVATSPVEAVESSSIEYEECNFVGQPAVVKMNGCDYNFEAGGLVDVNCPAGEEITFSVPNPVCDVTVPAQQNKGTIAYTNITTGTSKEITISPNVTGISYTAHGAGCPKTGFFSDGTYTTGNVIFTGQNPSEPKETINIQYNP